MAESNKTANPFPISVMRVTRRTHFILFVSDWMLSFLQALPIYWLLGNVYNFHQIMFQLFEAASIYRHKGWHFLKHVNFSLAQNEVLIIQPGKIFKHLNSPVKEEGQ
jgi:hypothetical protein